MNQPLPTLESLKSILAKYRLEKLKDAHFGKIINPRKTSDTVNEFLFAMQLTTQVFLGWSC